MVCIASGPSLTAEDCEAVRRSGHPTIVTNTTFRLAPWADVLFGFDLRWWNKYIAEVKAVFGGKLMSMSQISPQHGVATMFGSTWFRGSGNSGSCAISVALPSGAKKVVLLGYDAADGPNGEKHWHGDHPKGLSNALSMKRWPGQFEKIAAEARRQNVKILNASRRTALTCFERVELEAAL